MSKKKVRLENVVERYYDIEGDLNENSITDFLDCTEEERTEPCNRVGGKLEEIHDPERHGDLKQWANNGPFGPEVFREFGFDPDIFEKEIDKRIDRDANIIKRELGYEQPSNPFDTLVKSAQVLFNMETSLEDIRKKVPKDDPVWIADILLQHGWNEVSLYTWHAAQYLFKKNVEHKAKSMMEAGAQGALSRLDNLSG